MSQPVLSKDFVFSSFELGGITKHLMTGPMGNSELVSPHPQICFPRQSQGKQNSLGKTKLTVSLGASH